MENDYGFDFAEYNGKIEMNVFLDGLKIEERAKVIAYILKLVECLNMGARPSEKLSKHLTNGIFELRVPFRDRTSRSLFFYESEKMIIFTNGFVKKTEKTPAREIAKALKIRDYRRSGNE